LQVIKRHVGSRQLILQFYVNYLHKHIKPEMKIEEMITYVVTQTQFYTN